MRAYRQLTEDDRIEIYAMKQAGKQQNKIAAALGIDPSTVSRGLARKAVKMTPETIDYIECKLRKQHSPEQIVERGPAGVGRRQDGLQIIPRCVCRRTRTN